MVTAFILMNIERSRIAAAAQELLDIKGIAEVHSVAGAYDMVAVVRVKHNDDLADLVTNNLTKVQGIGKTETLIAFRQYSRYDLERMFSLGAGD